MTYIPVACELVDQIEILATRRKKINMVYLTPNRQEITTTIKTWFTKDKVEYLETIDGIILRLDKLEVLDDQDVSLLSHCKL